MNLKDKKYYLKKFKEYALLALSGAATAAVLVLIAVYF